MSRFPILLTALAMLFLLPACEVEPPSGSLGFTVEGSADLPEELQAVAINWAEEVTWTREVSCTQDSRMAESTYRIVAFDRSVGGGIDVGLAIQAYDGPGVYARDEFQPSTALYVSFLGVDAVREEDDSAGRDERDDDDSATDDDDSAVDDDDSAMDDDDSATDDDDSAVDDDDSATDDDDSSIDDDDAVDDDDVVDDDDDDLADDDDDTVADDDDDLADDDTVTDDDDDTAADDDDAVDDGRWEIDTSRGGACILTVNDDGLSGSFVCEEVPVWLDGGPQPDEVRVNGQWSCSELGSDTGGGGIGPFFP